MFKRRRSKTQSPHNSVGSGVSANNRQDTAGGGSAGGAASGGGASESGGSGCGGGGSGGDSDGGSSSQNSPPIPRGCIRLTSSNSDGPGNGSNGTLTVSLEGADGNSNLTTSTATNRSRSRRRRRRVRFRHVVVREFERVIGDNPSCSGGAPISIGWAFGKDRVMNVEEYEAARPIRRTQHELVLTRQDREEILIEWGATFNDIIESIRANVRAKNQRRRTVNAIGTYDRWEEAMETAGRRLKQTLLLQRTTKQQVKELKRQSELYAKVHGTRPGPSHPNEITAPSTEHDDVEALSLPEYYEEVDCDKSKASGKASDQAALGRSSGLRSTGGASQLTNNSPEAIEPDDEAVHMLAQLGVNEIPVSHHHMPQLGNYPYPPHYDRWMVPDQYQFANQVRYPQQQPPSPQEQQQQSFDPSLLLPCEGPVLEVGFSRDQAMIDPDDDLSTWCVTIDEQEYSHNGQWDMTNPTIEEDSMMGGPAILQNNMVPVVISEDGQYDLFEYNGFTMQPPPYSNQIISKWE